MTIGGPDVLVAGGKLTSGGDNMPSGGSSQRWRDHRALTALAYLAFGSVYMIVNATTLIDQRVALGIPIEAWKAWLLEFTSLVAWLILLPLILWLGERFLACRRLVHQIVCHAAACFSLSLAHTAIMVILRAATFALAGEEYSLSQSPVDSLVFELRKDVITYLSIVLVFTVARRLVATQAPSTREHQASQALIEVRDGTRTFLLKPDEIDWVEAAGNYVELHGLFGTKMARRTIADTEEKLSTYGFVRVHRSRIVRKSAIISIETRQSGDFDILLRSGARIGGSRRYRGRLQGE
ncbi:LytTR family DNA-binding domain-containing protein [Sandaracinobacteroides sp. A072]|uniref:LytTR family DNA-binding domain-containing protein n=1 Tax=Sandaracinobacteroides sp. A072 TaxID=3461146 RepID=UPI004042E994